MGGLEGVVLASAEFTDDVAVLLFEATQLLDKLVLIEIELEFVPDLIVEGGGVVVVLGGGVGAAVLGGVIEEALEQLNFVLIGPEALEELPRFVGRWGRGFLRRDRDLRLVVVGIGLPERRRGAGEDDRGRRERRGLRRRNRRRSGRSSRRRRLHRRRGGPRPRGRRWGRRGRRRRPSARFRVGGIGGSRRGW